HSGESRANLTQPHLVYRPGSQGQSCCRQQPKPRGLPKLGHHLEAVALLARAASRHQGAEPKPVVAMAQAVVVDDPARARVDPVRIDALQTVGISHTVRRAEMNAGVPNL